MLLMAPLWKDPPPGLSVTDHLQFLDLLPVEQAGGPELQPYQGLADAWDDYGSYWLPDYPRFLAALARQRGTPLRSVLDLACGTGLLTERLTRVSSEVVGLDASEPMVAFARSRCAALPGVELVSGDFRHFSLGRLFDAAVCASNSLNYVADRGELSDVFRAVGNHLRPGGLFAFDTTAACGMTSRGYEYLHFASDGHRFALRFSYDNARRVENAIAILPTGVEIHRRIPIDPADVTAAAEGTGLDVADHFSSRGIPGTVFFVLTKRG